MMRRRRAPTTTDTVPAPGTVIGSRGAARVAAEYTSVIAAKAMQSTRRPHASASAWAHRDATSARCEMHGPLRGAPVAR